VWDLREVISHEAGDLTMGLMSSGEVIVELVIDLCSLGHVKVQWEDSTLHTRKGALIRHWTSQHLDLRLSTLQNGRNKYSCASPSVYGILL
jgi:hypothetical protein